MNIIKISVVTVFFLFISACSSYSTGSTTVEPVSYLYFTGNVEGAQVSIDNAPAFLVTKSGVKQQYKVTPGKHTIVVSKQGSVVVKRSLLLGDGHEKEINIP